MGVTTHRFYFKEDRMRSTKPNNRIAPAVIAGVTIGLLVAGYKFVFANKKPKLERQDQQDHEKAQQEYENQKDRDQAVKEEKQLVQEEQQHEDKKAEQKQAAEADQQPK